MKRSLILSNFRLEFRRNNKSYKSEVSALRWLNRFFDELSISHSSQLRRWQIDYFISRLSIEGSSFDEMLQARSALRFLFENILKRVPDRHPETDPMDREPGSFRITG